MTKIDHVCDESCRQTDPLEDIGNLLKSIDDTVEQIDQYDRIIKSLRDLELDLYEDEAVSSFKNARSRYVHVLDALQRKHEQLLQ